MKFALIVLAAMVSQNAFAYTYAICGKKADLMRPDQVEGYELEISSENDKYSGMVGGNWELSLGKENSWVKKNRNITAKKTKDAEGNTNITINIVSIPDAIPGPVGVTYKLIGLYDDQPRLLKYAMGGFAGGTLIGEFICNSGND